MHHAACTRMMSRFLGEIKVTAPLQHPNILPFFDSGEADKCHVLWCAETNCEDPGKYYGWSEFVAINQSHGCNTAFPESGVA